MPRIQYHYSEEVVPPPSTIVDEALVDDTADVVVDIVRRSAGVVAAIVAATAIGADEVLPQQPTALDDEAHDDSGLVVDIVRRDIIDLGVVDEADEQFRRPVVDEELEPDSLVAQEVIFIGPDVPIEYAPLATISVDEVGPDGDLVTVSDALPPIDEAEQDELPAVAPTIVDEEAEPPGALHTVISAPVVVADPVGEELPVAVVPGTIVDEDVEPEGTPQFVSLIVLPELESDEVLGAGLIVGAVRVFRDSCVPLRTFVDANVTLRIFKKVEAPPRIRRKSTL